MLTRRKLFEIAAGSAVPRALAAAAQPKRIAVITTVYRYLSHGQHIADRFLVGYPFHGEWRRPNMKVVSLYVDQKPDGDLSSDRAREFGFAVYPTIAEALRCGGKQLAVDAVLLVGEHGDYPRNNKGQILYPRFEFFEQCTKIFAEDGRAVPVYNDKHLSYSFEKAKRMVQLSRQMRFPLLAGSSLPVTWRLPGLELPLGCRIQDALMVGNGGSDAMDFHALEAMQCMLERRGGGETGVQSVQLLDGDAVWQAGDDGRWSRELLSAALSRSDTPQGLTVKDGRTQDLVASGEIRRIVPHPAAYLIHYRDGLRAAMLMLTGGIQDFNFAAKLEASREPVSTQFFLSPVPNVTYSACLVHHIEQMFVTGEAPYSADRTLLTSGILESCLDSRANGNQPVETPHLSVRYRPPTQSQYCRT